MLRLGWVCLFLATASYHDDDVTSEGMFLLTRPQILLHETHCSKKFSSHFLFSITDQDSLPLASLPTLPIMYMRAAWG